MKLGPEAGITNLFTLVIYSVKVLATVTFTSQIFVDKAKVRAHPYSVRGPT